MNTKLIVLICDGGSQYGEEPTPTPWTMSGSYHGPYVIRRGRITDLTLGYSLNVVTSSGRPSERSFGRDLRVSSRAPGEIKPSRDGVGVTSEGTGATATEGSLEVSRVNRTFPPFSLSSLSPWIPPVTPWDESLEKIDSDFVEGPERDRPTTPSFCPSFNSPKQTSKLLRFLGLEGRSLRHTTPPYLVVETTDSPASKFRTKMLNGRLTGSAITEVKEYTFYPLSQHEREDPDDTPSLAHRVRDWRVPCPGPIHLSLSGKGKKRPECMRIGKNSISRENKYT